ncbi:MAG TPA: serine hydrolase domain-containing protein [Acidobacteriaceae bacterium]|jgi:CubicO group peptidase (beta-lactamase class C family)
MRISRVTVCLVLACLPLIVAGEVEPGPAALPSQQTKAIGVLVQDALKRFGAPGGTVAVGLDDKVVWAQGFGLADIENGTPARANTAYRTASIGKSITATAAMSLAEQGKLDLDAPIQKYCPRFPVKTKPILVRDLISHTSGIRHYGGPNEQAELFNTHHYDHVSDALDIFKDDPLQQDPGSDYLYSTWGYVTLGCVIEGATREEFRPFMAHAIFAHAGMTSTRDDDPRAIIPNRARGYIRENGVLLNSRAVDMSSKMAAGGWITTAPDLVRFMNASMAGRLISPKTLSLMLTPYRVKTGTIDGFGMGWALNEFHGLKAGVYGGGTPQVSGIILFIPEKKFSVAALFNLEDIPGDQRVNLMKAIADVVLGYPAENKTTGKK